MLTPSTKSCLRRTVGQKGVKFSFTLPRVVKRQHISKGKEGEPVLQCRGRVCFKALVVSGNASLSFSLKYPLVFLKYLRFAGSNERLPKTPCYSCKPGLLEFEKEGETGPT